MKRLLHQPEKDWGLVDREALKHIESEKWGK